MRWLAGLLAIGLGAGALGPGCACGAVPPTGPTPPAVEAPAPPASSAAEAPAPAPPPVEPLLADARLAPVARAVEAQDPAGAAQAIEKLLVDAPPAGNDRLRWLYQAGKLYAQAKRHADAQRVFAAAADAPWPLASYAALGAAQQALAAGRADDAIRLSKLVNDEVAAASAARLVAADAHEQRGALAEAAPLWRKHLEGLPASKPSRWVEVSVKLARALVVPGSDPAQIEEGILLARRVAVEQPASPHAARAVELERLGLGALPAPRRAALARKPDDDLTRAGALLEASRLSEAEAALAEFEAANPADGRPDEARCKVASIDARLKTKRKQRDAAADAYGEAIRRCSGDAKVTALFHGGGASSAVNRHAEALGRFDQLEREAPRHRLADDARLKGALAALAQGDEARFSSLLERMADAYPEGDMTTEGLFRLALHRMAKGDWAAAVAPLEASRKLRPVERDYWAAGRADYFLARALLATGDRARAIERLRAVIATHPLSYYMALAHARLAEIDATAATEALRGGTADAPPATPLPDHPSLRAPPFLRAVELLRQGEFELARAEFAAGHLTGAEAPPELQWVAASLYASVGADVFAHALPRGKLADWLEHYPNGSWRARWQLAYPRPYLDIAQREAKKSGTPLSLIYAIMREESAFDPSAVSSAPAYGLMQFTLDTAKNVGKKLNLSPINEAALKTPATSIALGSRFLADLRARYPACPALAIPSYNAGPGATRRWLNQRPVEDFDLFVERIPYDETRNYTKRVLKSYAAYLFLYEPELLSEALRLPARTQPGTPQPSDSDN